MTAATTSTPPSMDVMMQRAKHDIAQRTPVPVAWLFAGVDDTHWREMPLDKTSDPVADLAAMVLAVREGMVLPLVWCCLVTDSYMMSVDTDPNFDPEALRRGDLARRFQAGDPTVVNVLLAHRITRTGHVTSLRLPYKRTAFGISWGQLADQSDEVASAVVPDLLNEIVGYRSSDVDVMDLLRDVL